MKAGQKTLIKHFEELQKIKEHRKFFKDHLNLYQALNLVYNTEFPWLYCLWTIWSELMELPSKNGRIKPAFCDELARIVLFDLNQEGFKRATNV